jgi:hypothetical protein
MQQPHIRLNIRLIMIAVAVVAVSVGVLRARWKSRQEQEALRQIRLAIKQSLIRKIGQSSSAEQWISGRPRLPGNKNHLLSAKLMKELQEIQAELAVLQESLRDVEADQD